MFVVVVVVVVVAVVVFWKHVDSKTYILIKTANIPSIYLLAHHGRIQRGDRGSGPHPLKNHINIGFPSTPKSQNYQASIQWWAIIGTLAKRHFDGVSLAGQ